MPNNTQVCAVLVHHFSITGCSLITSSSTSHTAGSQLFLPFFFAYLMLCAKPSSYQFFHNKWFKQFDCHFFRKPHWKIFSSGPYHDNRTSRIVNTFAKQILTETTLISLSAYRKEISRLCFQDAVTGRPRRAVINQEHPLLSCSILFSLRTIISGAPSSNSLFRRLFLLIILLYRSFKSLVAKRPPSNCTIGRKSGGITGTAIQ